MLERCSRILYTLIYYCLLPLILLRLWWRGGRAPAYRLRWRERFGLLPASARPAADEQIIWVHAVSVGETLAALPLLHALQQRSEHRLFVTTTTPTGSERVRAALGESVYHSYAPYDIPDAIQRVLTAVRPVLLIVMETELWPNLIHCCHRWQVPVLVANARLSERSFRGYRRIGLLTRPMLRKLTGVAVQTEAERQRFIALGADEGKVVVTGNIKFDVRINADLKRQARTLKETLVDEGQRMVLLAASTHRGEDEIILDVFTSLLRRFTGLLLILAPRHPERFNDVAREVQRRGLTLVRRSDGRTPGVSEQVMLCDSMGELLLFYGACDIAFVGGSLVPVGGHNMLEPAAWGVPVLTGPHLFNFVEAANLLKAVGALNICETRTELEKEMQLLLNSAELRQQKGNAAMAVIEANRGAMDRVLAIIQAAV